MFQATWMRMRRMSARLHSHGPSASAAGDSASFCSDRRHSQAFGGPKGLRFWLNATSRSCSERLQSMSLAQKEVN